MKKEYMRKLIVLIIFTIFIAHGLNSVIGKSNSADEKTLNEVNFDNGNHHLRTSKNDILFQKLILGFMKLANFPAISAAIVKEDEFLWADGFGLCDIENQKDATEDSVYLVASISKTFTATAIMQLHEKGLFELDDDVNDYLPFILRNPNHPEEPITFRMLLAHQSSIATDLSTLITIAMPAGLEILGYPHPFLEDYLVTGGIYYRPQFWNDYNPGEDMYYANIGYALLGYLVEILSNTSFEEYCRKNIFEPLNMKNTSFKLSNLNTTNLAVPYDYQFGKYYPYIHYNILDYPAGGLRTTVADLSSYLIAFINGGINGDIRILEENSVEQMHEIHFPSDTYNFQYGLGFQIWDKSKDTIIGHTGGLFGVATKMIFRKSDKIGIIFFTNRDLSNYREIFAFSMIEQLLFWKAAGFSIDFFKESNFNNVIKSNQHLIKKDNLQNNYLIRSL